TPSLPQLKLRITTLPNTNVQETNRERSAADGTKKNGMIVYRADACIHGNAPDPETYPTNLTMVRWTMIHSGIEAVFGESRIVRVDRQRAVCRFDVAWLVVHLPCNPIIIRRIRLHEGDRIGTTRVPIVGRQDIIVITRVLMNDQHDLVSIIH